jgi:hypothetical protein
VKSGITYRGTFKNMQFNVADNSGLQQDVIISIIDTETLIDDSATVDIIPLQPAGSPAVFSAIDNDEDKYHIVRGKQLEFLIHTENGIDISTFAGGGDNRFKVEYAINDVTKPYWYGFLDTSGLQQDFMPDPNELLLVANDGLGSLRDIPLTKFDGTNPKDEFRIADLLAWALSKTGLSLKMYVAFNVQPVEYLPTGTTAGNWIYIQYNSGANVHYFVDLGASGIYDVAQPSPPPFPSTVDMGDLTKVADGPAGLALYIVSSGLYPGWINGIQDTGSTITATGVMQAVGMGHMYDIVYLWSKTFEQEINECEDCLSVIEAILGEFCYLEQHKGRWYIINEDEKDRTVLDIVIFNEDGSLRTTVQENPEKNIGAGLDMSFMNDDAIVSLERALAFLKLTYNYRYAKELVCNIDFSRGDFITDLPDETIEGQTYSAKSFDLECWIYEKGIPVVTQDSEMYVERLYNALDYEKERFLRMPLTATTQPYYARCLDKIPVAIKDRFTVGVSFKYSSDLGGAKPYQLQQIWLRLYGDDGSYWNYGLAGGITDLQYGWILSDATWPSPTRATLNSLVDDNTDLVNWDSISVDVNAVPVSGKLEILLLNFSGNDAHTKYFSSLKFEYHAYVNGSFDTFTGQYQKISHAIDTKAARDKEVRVSDSPNYLFKGALLVAAEGSGYELAPDFINIYTNRVAPYGEHQAWAVWNQYNRIMRKFVDVSIDGLQTDLADDDGYPDLPAMVHQYKMRDINANTTDGADQVRFFQLLHFEQDPFLSAWRGTFHEAFDTAIAKVYDDAHEFKYVTK